jgi:exo-beta-1,3-glucanase (GH17 family)
MKIAPLWYAFALPCLLSVSPIIAQAPRDTNITLKNPKPFKTICYSGYRQGQGPGWAEPTEQQVREDLRILATYTHEIRTYGSGAGTHGNEFVPKICDELGLKLHLGVWVDNTYSESENLKAVNDAIAVAKKGYASIKSVIVGNEYMFRVRSSDSAAGPAEARLIGYIKKVRAEIPGNIEVTNADTWGAWMDNSDALIESIDYLLWHTHPWWEQKAIGNVEAHMDDVHNKIKARLSARFKNKREVLGEVGWPSSADNPPAIGSETNQAQFFKTLHAWAWKQNFEYWSFAAFDESWKDAEGPVGGHWGLWNIDRTPKPIITGISTLIPRYMQWDSDGPASLIHNGRAMPAPASTGYSRYLVGSGLGSVPIVGETRLSIGRGAHDLLGRNRQTPGASEGTVQILFQSNHP